MAEKQVLTLGDKVRHWPVAVKDYFQELQMEMRHVTWPSRNQVRATTVVVIVTVFAFAAYFAVVDTIFTRLIGKLFQLFTKQS
jgi:preprotein translocase subunit SecE